MCGICGSFGSRTKVDIDKMTRILRHRGPDAGNVYSDDTCSLGHARLSIIDLSDRGRQPMRNENGTIWLVVNGEIYNYKALRDELRQKGHTFSSESDSETILHAWEEWGESFLHKLRGMFALAIYDKNKQRLILARDPMGQRPLYYAWLNAELVFASEIKALFEAGVPKRVNYNAIPTYLMYQYVMGENTLFAGVKKLPAGHMMVVETDRFRIDRYFSLSDEGCYMGRDSADETRELLEESVKLRLQSDVPVGVFLSGGVDSSAVAALYRRFYDGEFHTFTMRFNGHPDAGYARLVSDRLGTSHHEITVTQEQVADDIAHITWHHDEPLGDAATISNYYMAKAAKKQVTVVLAGEGGDEVFGGYPWHACSPYIEIMDRVPVRLRRMGSDTVWKLLKGDITDPRYHYGRVALFPLQTTKVGMRLYLTTAMNRHNLRWLLGEEPEIQEPITAPSVLDPSNQMLALDCLNKLPEQFLMKADKATMASAVEERVPLLDKELVKFAFSLDPKLKRGKRVLRDAVRDLLPQEVADRPKRGFGTPVASWLTDESTLREMAIDRLRTGRLLKDVCRKEALEKLVAAFAGDRLRGNRIMMLSPLNVVWSLFALQVWSDIWFSGGG